VESSDARYGEASGRKEGRSVADSSQQLQAIYLAGFEVEAFERFPNSFGLTKGNCIALVQPTPDGLKLIGQPGWRMGEVLGVLVVRDGKQVFQAKSELVEATPERLGELESFRRELEELMQPRA
jgi:hypothetical protein